MTHAIDKAGFWLLTACALLAPLPFGSNSPASAAFLGLMLSVCLLGAPFSPPPGSKARRLMAATLLVGAIIVVWSLLQVIPGSLGTSGHPIWSRARPFIENPASVLSVSRLQPLHSAGYVLLALSAFLAAIICVRTQARYIRFVQAIIGSAFLVTLLCLAQYHLKPGMLLWEEKRHYADAFTGTFVNPNTAATLYGVLLLVSVSICARELQRIGLYRLLMMDRSWSREERGRLRAFAAYCACAMTFAVALMLTRSRAGILSSAAALAVFVSAYVFLVVVPRSSLLRAIASSAGCALGLGALLAVLGERILQRIRIEGLFDEGRLCVYRSTWAAIRDNIWWGTGLGTFQDVFPAYRLADCGVVGYWDMAHSVYLEAWLGLGAAFFVCLGLIYYGLIGAYVIGLSRRRRFRFVPLQGLCVVLLLSLHSLVDFSLQIPGLAVIAAAVLGAGASVALGKGAARTVSAPRKPALAPPEPVAG